MATLVPFFPVTKMLVSFRVEKVPFKNNFLSLAFWIIFTVLKVISLVIPRLLQK